MALTLALMGLEVGPGDEVIVPNRTWIATAHAPLMLGAKVILVDVEHNRPIIDCSKIAKLITKRTKAIIPVHMNGRSANMEAINKIAGEYGISVIEDAAQAFGSKNINGFLGTQSTIGIFSLSLTKIISTGQGGFLVTNNDNVANKLRAIRTHGIENIKEPKSWVTPGHNFRFNDILASIGLVELRKLDDNINRLSQIYKQYQSGLDSIPTLKFIPVNRGVGEIPIYMEFLCKYRDELIQHLDSNNIDSRPFYPNLNKAHYFKQNSFEYPNADIYDLSGIYLPSGPGQTNEDIDKVIECIRLKFS